LLYIQNILLGHHPSWSNMTWQIGSQKVAMIKHI